MNDDEAKIMSKILKEYGINIKPALLKLTVSIGEYLEKHPELLEKVGKANEKV